MTVGFGRLPDGDGRDEIDALLDEIAREPQANRPRCEIGHDIQAATNLLTFDADWPDGAAGDALKQAGPSFNDPRKGQHIMPLLKKADILPQFQLR